jgi:hypothetical protein
VVLAEYLPLPGKDEPGPDRRAVPPLSQPRFGVFTMWLTRVRWLRRGHVP